MISIFNIHYKYDSEITYIDILKYETIRPIIKK